VDELLPPVLEPAQQLGAIIRMANSIAEDVICDRAKRIRDQSASWKDGVKGRGELAMGMDILSRRKIFSLPYDIRTSSFAEVFRAPIYVAPRRPITNFLAAVTAGRGWEGDR